MNVLKKEKKWQEDLKIKIKKLRERAEEKPEIKKIDIEEEKPVVTEKNQYVEIKEEEAEVKEKPEVAVKIEKENNYAVIKPIIDEIKEKAKEEIYEEKIKEEKNLHPEKIEKIEVPRKDIESAKIEIETTIDKLIDIIDKRGTVTTLDLSKELNVSMDRIENWAKILEDSGLINIEYPLIGPSKLRKKEWKKES